MYLSACPLVLPDVSPVSRGCGDGMNDQISCCSAMDSYISHLQKQSFLTNLQALNCATSLGMKLQKANITKNIYNLCHISLKDFSLQGLFCVSLIYFLRSKYYFFGNINMILTTLLWSFCLLTQRGNQSSLQ